MKQVASFLIFVCIFAIASLGQVYARIDRITIERFKPSAVDMRAIKFMDKSAADQSDATIVASHPIYVVKIVADMPELGAQQPRLLIGDKKVPTAGGFSKGLYMKVYTQKQLADWAGKTVKIVIPTPVPVKSAAAAVVLFPSFTQPTLSAVQSQADDSEPGTLLEVLNR
jgi:hypothetical protein